MIPNKYQRRQNLRFLVFCVLSFSVVMTILLPQMTNPMAFVRSFGIGTPAQIKMSRRELFSSSTTSQSSPPVPVKRSTPDIVDCAMRHAEALIFPQNATMTREVKDCLAKLKNNYMNGSLIASFLKQPVLHPFYHNFTINHPDACSLNTKVIFLIPSNPKDVKLRLNVRKGYKERFVQDPKNRAALMFFLGMPDTPPDKKPTIRLMNTIVSENRVFGDILLLNFTDQDNTFHHKAISMLKWATHECVQADIVIRMEPDVNLNMAAVVKVMRDTMDQLDEFVVGKMHQKAEPARSNDRWKISEEEYPEKIFPPFVTRGLMGFPMATARLLFEVSLRMKPIWLDDVFISGLCRAKVGIPILNDTNFVFTQM